MKRRSSIPEHGVVVVMKAMAGSWLYAIGGVAVMAIVTYWMVRP
jgi:predicted acyltransferase